jgi:hypothetical protein
MPRFTIKDILRGITFASLGCGMLAIAFQHTFQPATKMSNLTQAFLVAFGGLFIGYGLAFPLKWPPYQMVMAMLGMFAAQGWQAGNIVGLIAFMGTMALLLLPRLIQRWIGIRATKEGDSSAEK